ncbi:azurin [Gelidibacter maritimus]|uniref:Azurin n=1 Tax=Gelidibacter maritimus TaxID=2761487 RepID=A0A7W2M501_9FLAO|nr:azurin [Gelidibacter maritimus]MBA6152840.1 azurin [Gelidibacter maritimus]
MKRNRFTSTFLIVTLALVGFVSCQETSKTESVANEMTPDALEKLSKQDTITILLNSNDKMQFDKTEITAYEGQTIILTLKHTGTMPVTAMGHNFVLISNGISVSEFAKIAIKAKENDYIPTDLKHVIAYTDLIGGGESTSVTFKAPAKGTYDFLCSFPGHYAIMKGKFNVK